MSSNTTADQQCLDNINVGNTNTSAFGEDTFRWIVVPNAQPEHQPALIDELNQDTTNNVFNTFDAALAHACGLSMRLKQFKTSIDCTTTVSIKRIQ